MIVRYKPPQITSSAGSPRACAFSLPTIFFINNLEVTTKLATFAKKIEDMDITLNIPLNAPIPAFSLAELRNALQEYALSWIAKTNAHKQQKTDEFELPEEFEKLCGSISQDKLKALAPNDERINNFI